MSDERDIETVRRELNEHERSFDHAFPHLAKFGPHYFDREGKPIGMGDWTVLFEDMAYRRVAEDRVGDIRVSTVWLGLDHSVLGPRPLIFETMAFDEGLAQRSELLGRDVPPAWDEFMRRYSTETEAVAGHAEVLAEVRRLLS